jgi:hypothetical protein
MIVDLTWLRDGKSHGAARTIDARSDGPPRPGLTAGSARWHEELDRFYVQGSRQPEERPKSEIAHAALDGLYVRRGSGQLLR